MNSTLSLNEQISTMLEPKPEDNKRYYKPPIAWEWVETTRTNGPIACTWTWYPIQWDTDEAACARLLEAMPQPGLGKQDDGSWDCTPDQHASLYKEGFYHHAADRKTAICLAFIAYFSGLSAEAQEQVRKEIQR